MKKPFLIAEIGINHNGDMNIVKSLLITQKKPVLMLLNFRKEK